MRSKYLVLKDPIHLAGLLDLALPTGSARNFQGTGTTRVGTYLIASRSIEKVFEPHAEAGVEFDADDVDRSQAKYNAGVSVQVTSFADLMVDFIGRSEFAAQTRIPGGGFPNPARLPAVKNGVYTEEPSTAGCCHGEPYFVTVKRNDVLDLAVGAKFALSSNVLLFASAIVPLNNDGLRANVVPIIGLEGTFDAF